MKKFQVSETVVERFWAVVIALLVVFGVVSLVGCASTALPVDPCADCPFTSRPAPVWSPPALESAPGFPVLEAEGFTAANIEADSPAFIAALVSDHLVLKAALLELHHLYTSALEAFDGLPPPARPADRLDE